MVVQYYKFIQCVFQFTLHFTEFEVKAVVVRVLMWININIEGIVISKKREPLLNAQGYSMFNQLDTYDGAWCESKQRQS